MEPCHSTSTTPTGSPKRPAVNDPASSPSKRSRPDGPAADTRDDEFWYIDGTVIIRVNKSLFRVHGSRLARYCVYFQKLFESGASAGHNETLDGCPVYHVPAGLSPNGFKDLLKALDTPLEFTAKPPSQTLAISLLIASAHLSCQRVHDLAHRRLCELWDAARPPPPDDPFDARKWSTAVYTIELARKHDVPGVLKRAFYELASSVAFFEAARTRRESVRLPGEDLLMLFEVRFALGRMWRDWIMELDVKKREGGSGIVKEFRCMSGSCGARVCGDWLVRVREHGLLDKGAIDPLRYNVVRKAKEAFEGHNAWCESCRAEKEEAWRTKCVEWWGSLDSLFGLCTHREYASNPPSQELAISLLFAADTLACDLVLELAKKRLSEIWDGNALPATGGSDFEDRTYPFAIRAIKLARQYSIPVVLRRAFYELLSSRAFWDALEPRPSQSVLEELRVSEQDVRTLFAARVKLGALWRELVMQVPEGTTYRYQRSPYDMRWCCNYDEQSRAGKWRTFVFEKGALEVLDPLRYDFMAEWGKELREEGKWCQACVDRKRKVSEEIRGELWERMDDLFVL